jgi:acetate kinase
MILVLNVGSTSLKVSLYAATEGDRDAIPRRPVWDAQVAWVAPPAESAITVQIHTGATTTIHETTHRVLDTPVSHLAHLLVTLWNGSTPVVASPREIVGVAHRIVFGGPALHTTTRLTASVRARIAQSAEDAPIHNTFELAASDGRELKWNRRSRIYGRDW